MRTLAAALAALVLAAAPAAAQTRTTLDIYVVDVEGGNATLYVAPSGASVLIDSGNGGAAAARDAGRIFAAAKDAGLSRIDTLITTHWHGDHYGGMAELARLIPVGTYVDHGASVQQADEFVSSGYARLYGAARHRVVAPGDTIDIAGLDWRIVMSAGQPIGAPLAGAGGANPHCAGFTPMAVDTGENAQSVGSVISFGRFRTAHLGDLTWNKEFELMCPANRLGAIDLFVVSHHGQSSSNSPALVHAIAPRVAIMNNGTRKGGQPESMRVLHSSPGLEDLWQIHFSLLSGQEYTVPGMFVANAADAGGEAMPIAPMTPPAPGPGAPPPPAHDGTAFWIKVQARDNGTFTVTNARNGFSKTYAPR